MTLRRALPQDAALILGLIRELAEYERLSDDCLATEEAVSATLFGPRPEAEVVLAELDRVPVGFALYFTNYSTFLARPGLYLEDLYVRPEARGRGVGKALLRELARIAVGRGAGRMEWAVLDWNEPAIGFYRSLGAVMKEDWRLFRLTGRALEKLAEEGR